MGAVEPLLFVIISASDLNSAVTGAEPVCLEFKFKCEVGVFFVCEEPDVVVVGAADGIGEDSAVFDFEEVFVFIVGGGFYYPAGEVLSVEEDLCFRGR